jgi:hypothetical protein
MGVVPSPRFLIHLAVVAADQERKVGDEGMPNGPSIFAYLVFGPGGTTAEGITRPIH